MKNNELPLSRRSFLHTAGTAATVTAAATVAARVPFFQTKDSLMANEDIAFNRLIDAHVHVWTPDTERYSLAPGFRRDEMKPPSFTPEELLQLAIPCGVDRIALIQMSFYGFDNSYMLDTIKKFPGKFSGVAVIDEQAKNPADTMRTLKKQGVRGFRIYPRNMPVDRWLDSDGMKTMWKTGAEEGMNMGCLINPDALPALDKMCEKFPETTVVIDHFARIGVDGTIREKDLEALCKLARHKHTAVKLSAFYALGKKKAPYEDLIFMIRRLLEAYGTERLMWATDCPYQVQEGHKYEPSVALIRNRLDFLSRAERLQLLRKTAERIYFS